MQNQIMQDLPGQAFGILFYFILLYISLHFIYYITVLFKLWKSLWRET